MSDRMQCYFGPRRWTFERAIYLNSGIAKFLYVQRKIASVDAAVVVLFILNQQKNKQKSMLCDEGL